MRILFITCSSVGDAVLSTGLLNHLLLLYPEADFTIAAGPASAPLFAAFPRLEKLIVICKQKRKMHWFTLWNSLRGTAWDMAVDLRGSALTFLLRVKKRKVFAGADKRKAKLDQLGELFGLEPAPHPHIWISPAARQAARALLPDSPVIVLIPLSNSPFKDWPLERYATLAKWLMANPAFCTSSIAVLGLENQRSALAPLFTALPVGACIDLIGKTDLLLACAVLQQAQLVIGNDSGMLHIAGALGKPLVGIYGPTNDGKYAPRGEHVRIAKVRRFAPTEREIQDPEIIKQVTVAQVQAAVEELLQQGAIPL